MQWFLNFSTRAKLFLSCGLLVMLLAVVISTAYSGMKMMQQAQQAITGSDAVPLQLMTLRNNTNRQRMALLIMMAAPAQQAQLEQEVAVRTHDNDKLLQQLLDQNNSKSVERLKQLQAIYRDFSSTRDTQIIPLIKSGKVAAAQALTLGVQEDRYNKMRGIAESLSSEAQGDAQATLTQSTERANKIMLLFELLGLGALLLGLGLVLLLDHLIATPLKIISAGAERIATGDLSVQLPTQQRRDEVGTLTQTFGRMAASLQGMAGIAQEIAAGDLRVVVKPQSEQDVLGHSFAAMVANLQRVIADITEGANVLGSAATEIVASTTQLASSSTETATAVSETTTTVEEVRQTAQISSQKARLVAESAQKAAVISQSGKQATDDTTSDMQHIREQMESIAASMVRLSEQSQVVGEIIATVDDLAQQSNLLAVNASIEAAKAGDQGKGFAVVAQEVKTLAEQSKQATTQVRVILNDIQKATGAAVMATEQGTKAVEAGVLQSAQAGDSILTLADSIDEATQAATQIAASSQEQLIGMDQVVLAMENIKQASTQNVGSARQLEDAARGLNDLGQRLKQLAERYQV